MGFGAAAGERLEGFAGIFNGEGEDLQGGSAVFEVIEEDGWFAQAGYFLLPERLEGAARYSFVRVEEARELETTEVAASLSLVPPGRRTVLPTVLEPCVDRGGGGPRALDRAPREARAISPRSLPRGSRFR